MQTNELDLIRYTTYNNFGVAITKIIISFVSYIEIGAAKQINNQLILVKSS